METAGQSGPWHGNSCLGCLEGSAASAPTRTSRVPALQCVDSTPWWWETAPILAACEMIEIKKGPTLFLIPAGVWVTWAVLYVWNLCGGAISSNSLRNNYHKTHLPSQEINLSVTHVCSCVFTMPAIAAARYLCVLTSPVHLRAYPGRHQLRRFMLDDWCSTACASRAVDCFALEKGKGPTVHRPSYTKVLYWGNRFGSIYSEMKFNALLMLISVNPETGEELKCCAGSFWEVILT